MKKLIKLIAVLLVLAMSITACGSINNQDNSEMYSEQNDVNSSEDIGKI